MGTLIETDAWTKWDMTSMRLQALSWRSRRIKQMVGDMEHILRDMLECPNFKTNCEDELDKLIIELATVHEFAKVIRDIYRKKPATA